MTSPATIAAMLTPAQVRALKDCAAKSPLRNPELVAFDCEILPFERANQVCLLGLNLSPTPLGLAVLAELERMGK